MSLFVMQHIVLNIVWGKHTTSFPCEQAQFMQHPTHLSPFMCGAMLAQGLGAPHMLCLSITWFGESGTGTLLQPLAGSAVFAFPWCGFFLFLSLLLLLQTPLAVHCYSQGKPFFMVRPFLFLSLCRCWRRSPSNAIRRVRPVLSVA